MTRKGRWAMGLILAAVQLAAQAGGMYRCGNTFSDKPCPEGRELKHYASGTIHQDGGGPKELGAQLCRDRFVEHFRIENPERVRIHQVSGGQSDIIAYGASRQTTARTFQVEVMVRNAYGVFLGPEIYRCHTTDDGRRLLRYAR